MNKEEDWNTIMQAYASGAVEYVKQNSSGTLDFSVDSIFIIEFLAKNISETVPKNAIVKLFKKGPSSESIESTCKTLGGYVGEVIRKNKGGDWAYHEELASVGIKTGSQWCFPINKVYKRIMDGEGDNLITFVSFIMNAPNAE